MKMKDMKTAIMAQQDQDLEEAKRWLRGNGPAGTLNAQTRPLWEACCLDHSNPLIDIMSRFALIGIRHTLSQLEAQDVAAN